MERVSSGRDAANYANSSLALGGHFCSIRFKMRTALFLPSIFLELWFAAVFAFAVIEGHASAFPGEFQPLFNGRDLDGWIVRQTDDRDWKVNRGFSGNGLGEPALAEAICELNPACVVLDFGGNPSASQYAAALPVFADVLRAKWRPLPILVTTPFYLPAVETSEEVARSQTEKRRSTREFVDRRRAAGDNQIWFGDGLKMLKNQDQAVGLVDGVHCNSLGFFFNAQGLEPFISRALSRAEAN